MGSRRTPRTVGRPSLLTADLERDLVEKVRAGVPLETAAATCGIARSTLFMWLTKGRDEVEARIDGAEANRNFDHYVALYEKLTKSRAEAGARNVLMIQKAAAGGQIVEKRTITHTDGTIEEVEKRAAPDWRAAAWFLERTQRGQFGKDAVQVELTGADGGPVQISSHDAESIASQVTANLAKLAAGAARPALPAGEDPAIEDAEIVDD